MQSSFVVMVVSERVLCLATVQTTMEGARHFFGAGKKDSKFPGVLDLRLYTGVRLANCLKRTLQSTNPKHQKISLFDFLTRSSSHSFCYACSALVDVSLVSQALIESI